MLMCMCIILHVILFSGAVEILRNLEMIDFHLLFAGKVCIDELPRIRRLARMDCIKVPQFLMDIEKYKKSLRQIAILNGLVQKPERRPIQSKPIRKRPKSRRNNTTEPLLHTPTPPVQTKRQYSSTSESTDSSVSIPESTRLKPIRYHHHKKGSKTVRDLKSNGRHPLETTGVTNMPNEWVDEDEEEIPEELKLKDLGKDTIDSTDRLLGRPRSLPNKMGRKRRRHKISKKNKEELGWFGLLNRNADCQTDDNQSGAPKV